MAAIMTAYKTMSNKQTKREKNREREIKKLHKIIYDSIFVHLFVSQQSENNNQVRDNINFGNNTIILK